MLVGLFFLTLADEDFIPQVEGLYSVGSLDTICIVIGGLVSLTDKASRAL
jgi:hypothetical protein